jgi:mono/diheme cytochrome c family protein
MAASGEVTNFDGQRTRSGHCNATEVDEEQRKMSIRLSLLLLAGGLLSSASAVSADLERGRALHDTHCQMCHDSVAYRRENKTAKTYEEVRAQVNRWQTNTSLRWSAEDVENVTAYLVQTYYNIPCPNC